MTKYLTPPALAKRWGCKPETVIAHIRRGELRAFTTSAPGCRRPRWKIPPDAVTEFEQRRQPCAPPKAAPRRQKKLNVIEFY